MKGKKINWLILSVVFLMVFGLAGCWPGVATEPEAEEVATEPEPKEVVREFEVVFANAEGPGYEVGLQHTVAEWIEERTEGAITFTHVVGGALGGDKTLTEQISEGILKLGRTGGYPSSVYLDEWMPMNVPFLFENWEQIERFLDKFRDDINEAAAEYNLYILAWTRRGPRQTTSKVPLYEPEDFEGLKIRLPEFPVWVKVWETLGVIPTPMAFPEVYAALEKGVIDAQENPAATIYAAKFYEVQDYLILSEHMHWITDWTVNLEWLMGLPDETRETIKEAFLELEKHSAEAALLYDEEVLKLLAEEMVVIEPNAKAIREAAMPGVRKVVNEYLRPEVKDWLAEEGLF